MNLKQYLMILLFVPAIDLSGQDIYENNFDHYTKTEGMSHNTVTGLAQDSAGYMWISTSFGLNRYNGSRFVQFHSNNDSFSLGSEAITGITWIDKERLAVYGATGVHIVNTKTGENHNLFIPYPRQQYLYKFNMVQRVTGDDSGNMYVLTRSGFYHFDKNYELVSRFDYYSEKEVHTEHFFFGNELLELDGRQLLIVSAGGLYVYDKEKKQVRKMNAADCPLMAEFLDYPLASYSFFQGRAGDLFILKSDSDTIVYINISQNKKTVSRLPLKPIRGEVGYRSRMIPVNDTLLYITGHLSGFFKLRFYPESGMVKMQREKFFNAYFCTSLLNDKENNLWVATNKGLFRQNPQKKQVQFTTLPVYLEDSFPNINLADVYASHNKVYAGARGQGGLLVFNKRALQLEKQIIFSKVDKRNNSINAIVPVNASTLLLGTNGLPFLYDELKEKPGPFIPPNWDKEGEWTNDLFKDSNGNIWISAASNIYRYNPVTQNLALLPNHSVSLMMPVGIEGGGKSHLWMASHGLARYNTISDTLDLRIDSFPFIKMPDKQVNAFIEDQDNTLWFNSNNNGLIAYNIDRKTFRHFTRKDGLPDDNIVSVIIIDDKLWLACYSGVACMDLKTSEFVSFGKEDGFPDMPVVKGARFFYDSTDQQLYLCFSQAVVRFNPHNILQRKSPSQLFIENLAINEKNNFLPGQQFTTSWHDNEIMITIGSINFSDGNSQRFAYRILKDSLTPWQQLGSQPSFSISNLSPGTHKIEVKCFSLNNRWPEQVKEISIVVLPPIWMKDWFITLLSGILLVVIYLLIQWRINMIRRKEEEKTHIQKLKADDYKNQFELEQISNYFSSSLAGKNTEAEVLWDVTNNLMSRMNYEDCVIYLWNEDKTKMVQKAAYGPKGKPEIISANVFEVKPGQGIVGHVIQSRQPLLINDTRLDSRYRVDDEFRLSEVCVPIIHNDELLGTIDSEHSLPNYFSDRDIKILTTIATLIGNKLKQIESEQSLEAKRKELANINEQLAEARLTALQAQMNPHFVFNALNSIKRMILDGDNEKGSRYLSKFALMIRMTLEHSKEVFVTLQENVEYLKAYLEMEQLRFNDSFTYNIFTGENIDTAETMIPSLMIQPIVENAIWHGLMQADMDKRIMIAFTQYGNKIVCTIEDNGIGLHESERLKETTRPLHRSTGLENLQKRIKIINEKYNTDCSLEIFDLKDTCREKRGTRVVLRFNVINM